MEFPKNIAEQLDGDSVGPLRAWRHQMICKLIDAGVTNPEEIESSVDRLYNFLVSPTKNDIANSIQPEGLDLTLPERRINGINTLHKLIDQADLTKDQLDDIKLYLNPYSFLDSKKV
ncbi:MULTISPECIES: hypothetical protein [Acinetobacter calcoaceticus/baumannii complex]|nr:MULTISPECIES: hypothetical protein [Acinetobacter calcoaceticus/baumannii complex]KJX72756.1 hypothetical protein WH42_09750 [Acinetobacter baumannii]MBF6755941.1 hypothetical protein [Acinetobacter baumannii]MCT9547264.1 hypothetical protein [Acinetobacter baumannii]MDC4478690.1 hypothetical protein [Acinetobacter baumannii]MDC4649269.1 hypothetical protein [Acinetobacter baumannii]